MIKVILADDHQLIRQTLKRLLAKERDWQVVAEADDGLEAVRLAKELRPDVVVTDLTMPGLHGLEVTRQIHRHCRGTRIVVVSIHADEQYVRQAMQNGALGYVRKDEVGQNLLPAIRAALEGTHYLSPSVAGYFTPFDDHSGFAPRRIKRESLTRRERTAPRIRRETPPEL